MVKTRLRTPGGFTLMEVMITMLLMVVLVSMAVGGWLFMMYGHHANSMQQELDIGVRVAMENFKNDLRLSSVDKVIFYPNGSGPYNAISFPKARDDDGDGLVDLDDDGKILWDQTIIYHIYSGSPNQLRRTVFDPRDETLNDEERYTQLVNVVDNGQGSGANTYTNPLFSNLFDWELSGKSAVFDGYSAVPGKASNATLGSVLVDSGPHTITFRAIGKNPSSTGFVLGLDALRFTPSASVRELEAQTITETIGSWAEAVYMPEGSWGGNHQVLFHGDGVNDAITFSLDSDRWEETNFIGTDAQQDKAIVVFDQSLSPDDFVVMLPGGGYNWFATDQTGDSWGRTNPSDGAMAGTALRMLIKGNALGGAIQSDGGKPWILLYASTGGSLKIEAAYLAESASTYDNLNPNTLAEGIPLRFNSDSGSSSKTLHAGTYAWAVPETGSTMEMDADKTYALTLLLANSTSLGNAPYYTNTDTNSVETFVLPKTGNPTTADAAAADWSSQPYTTTPNLYAISATWPQRRSNGYYTSPIFDTHKANPAYQSIDWNDANGSGTALRFKVRTGQDQGLSDAPDWASLPWITTPGPLEAAAKRYIQFYTHLAADPTGWQTPRLKDVTLTWQPDTRITDLAVTHATGPDKGIYEVEVDGAPLIKGVTATIEIYQDVPVFGENTKKLTSAMTQEIEPRNTGY